MTNLSRTELVERLRTLAPEMEARGVRGLALFGSRARGDNRHDSDVDIALDVPEGSRFSLFDLMDIEAMVTDIVGVPAHATLARSVESWLAQEIARDAVPILP